MKIIYSRGIAAFLLLFVFSFVAHAHNNETSHTVLQAIGDANRAVMDNKNGYGGSVFTLSGYLDVIITNEARKPKTIHIGRHLGTAFIPECFGCKSEYLLTNRHVADFTEDKEKFIKDYLVRRLTPQMFRFLFCL
ncbi:MAG: hypothetical protein HYT94_01700 [Parcubacteria group bacterium]|nr:hypothetical protein [Parcubacteria group bacterium]